jgi:hypothetical protein
MGKGEEVALTSDASQPYGRRCGVPDRLLNGDTIMRFLGYTLGDDSVPTPPPSPDLYVEMGKFVEEATKAGVLLATGGLAPSAQGTKVTYRDGEFTVIDGPFAEAKELIGGWALMEVRDKDEAIEWTKRFLSVVGEGESTIRQVF